jgi:hypothetical protein
MFIVTDQMIFGMLAGGFCLSLGFSIGWMLRGLR